VIVVGADLRRYASTERSLPPLPAVVLHDADARAAARALARRAPRHAAGQRADGRRSPGPKLIALTFDDGPYPVDTPMLLQRLAPTAHVPATFFLIGRDAEQFPELAREIAAAGDEIADHTLTHPDLDALDDAGVTPSCAMEPRPSSASPPIPPSARCSGRRTAATRTRRSASPSRRLRHDPLERRPGRLARVSARRSAGHTCSGFATAPEIVLLHSGRPATIARWDRW
jgi:hypothetical protein